ncbi:MAG: integrase arm-type DNA-binding domain-containing protein, partial [Epsilonproteobacteria bacterium]|nr:integrase arm-type DNA-binding domain-containing protein [Campylobacterota bacterium]
MARQTRPLTATEIKNVKPKEKKYTLSDGGGLFLRVMPNGSKFWKLSYDIYCFTAKIYKCFLTRLMHKTHRW